METFVPFIWNYIIMNNKPKYPIGTIIRFLYHHEDCGKLGTIVAYHSGRPTIYIPTAKKHVEKNRHPVLSDGTKYTWHCGWDEIEEIELVGQQLLFNFMYEKT